MTHQESPAGTVDSPAANHLERLADLAATHRDAQQTVKVHSRRLHAAVVEAIDSHGYRPAEVARAIGVSPTRVYAIITGHYQRT